MTVSPIQSPSVPSAAADSQSRTNLTSDYEMFLKMLTTQMTNQDPLNPVDSSDYAVQLATFSSVEQQVRTNELLTELTNGLNGGGLSDLAGWIDRDVRSASPAYFSGTPITIAPQVDISATRAVLSVRNSDGIEVQSIEIPVDQDVMTWAGVDSSGNPLRSDNYSFEVTSFAGEEPLGTSVVETYATVIEARVLPEGISLVLDGGNVVSASQVTALRM